LGVSVFITRRTAFASLNLKGENEMSEGELKKKILSISYTDASDYADEITLESTDEVPAKLSIVLDEAKKEFPIPERLLQSLDFGKDQNTKNIARWFNKWFGKNFTS
jgi:hypothetical protein